MVVAAAAQLPQPEGPIRVVVTGESICCLRTMEDISDTIRGAVLDAAKARSASSSQKQQKAPHRNKLHCDIPTDPESDTALLALQSRLLSSVAGLGGALHVCHHLCAMTCHCVLPGVSCRASWPRLEGGAAARDAASAASQTDVRSANE